MENRRIDKAKYRGIRCAGRISTKTGGKSRNQKIFDALKPGQQRGYLLHFQRPNNPEPGETGFIDSDRK